MKKLTNLVSLPTIQISQKSNGVDVTTVRPEKMNNTPYCKASYKIKPLRQFFLKTIQTRKPSDSFRMHFNVFYSRYGHVHEYM